MVGDHTLEMEKAISKILVAGRLMGPVAGNGPSGSAKGTMHRRVAQQRTSRRRKHA
jgi:hypothetical protein